MPSSSTIFACAISILGFTSVSASPLGARGLCYPNFEGAPLTVINGGNQWGVSSADVDSDVINTYQYSSYATKFRFEQSGSPDTTYIIKLAENNASNELVVAASDDGWVKVAKINDSGNDPTQTWNVVCNTCSTDVANSVGEVATGCYIQLESTGDCVQFGANPGDDLFLSSCYGSDTQTFNFWAN